MNLFLFRFAICILISLLESFLFALENKEIPNRFTLTNGYLEESFNSNEGMAYFPMSIYETYDWGFRKISADKYGFGRFSSWFISGLFQMFYFNSTYMSTPYHEFGHGTRFRSLGSNNITYYIDSNHTVTAGSYFEMVFNRVNYSNEGAATSSVIISQNPNDSIKNDLIVSAGGMNNEILLSKLITERVYDRGGSVPDFFFYLENKLSPYNYSSLNTSEFKGGDPQTIQNDYASLGKNITTTDLKNSYLFSLLASGSFYSLLWGDLYYIGTGNHNVKTIDIYGVSLPDFSTYINSKGLSMETMMHYRVNEVLTFGLSYEKVYIGDNYDQISPQFRYVMKLNSGMLKYFIAKPQLIIGLGNNGVDLGGSLLSEVEGDYLGLFLKYTYYNQNNLYGERNIPFINKPNEILGGVFFNLF
ncbi:hypothetical protein GCL60_11890 [Silvanigrella paludirubra]|uniref:Uncharacterized protein n=1 Tax=Silvanigrella paludirubra TaxID=2499159 RepID=A0A6N6VQK3_9BACT|nr:hypothetical protein [Silvanigrella paludirubra]KAB8037869.1 hypothetical protein GCL60_11890 [Silvanigrella paludirubra]